MKEEDLKKEKEYLNSVLSVIEGQILNKEDQLDDLENEMRDLTHHFSDQYYFLDDEETVTAGDELDDSERVINEVKKQVLRLKKQKLSPYFAKIDFKADDDDLKSYYIGVFNLTDGKDIPLVCDWRAPLSTMYYDYELGRASYVAPIGVIKGEILGKRQFKIKDGKMELCFDSDLTIQDDILQKELANNSSQKMKNIVSTLQREQNKIIRNEDDIIFVQGVAGSGKTSIALHRVAYLLYKYREKYKSEDILIISPNMIFSEYISNVLPSLGEENILETSFYRLAEEELVSLCPPLQTREEALDELTNDFARLNEVAYKSSFDFCDSLKLYLKTYVNLSFNAKDLTFGDLKITKNEIEILYNKKYIEKTPAIRIDWIADYILDKLQYSSNSEELLQRIKKVLYPMFINSSLVDIYADYLDKIGMKFSLTDNGKIKNEDIAGILYIKNYCLGLNKHKNIKYVVIDEMQDYSPLQFEMFNQLYQCPKTVLGDIYQCIDKIIEYDELDKYAKILGAKSILTLNKTYRSTYEITMFANKIKGLNNQCVDRHGDEVIVEKFENIEKECEFIENLVKNNKKFDNIAIICKTNEQAQLYYAHLSNLEELMLIDEKSSLSKLMIMSSGICKGLEFDMVIMPNVSAENYNNFMDKNLLYVSSTRALHKLVVTCHSDVSKFIN